VYLNPAAGAGLWYEEEVSAGVLKRRHYISGTEGAVVQVTRQAGVADQERWWHKDHLGSTTVVTNEAGAVVERLGYEPFGKRRGADGTTDAAGTLAGATTDRGYTGHEMLDEVGLVHMNGRIYDPAIGRFLSADPHVPDPSDIQSHNRYSYVRNRPMSVTDPSGFWDEATGTSSFPVGSGMYGIDMPFRMWSGGMAASQGTLPQGAGFALGYDSVLPYNNSGMGFQATADVRAIDNKVVIPGRDATRDPSMTALPPTTPPPSNWFIAAANAVNHFQRNTELGRNLQAIPSEGQAAGAVKAGLLLIAKLAKGADAGADAAKGAANFSRELKAADLGVKGTVQELSGTFAVKDGVATMRVYMIRGEVQNPLQVVGNMAEAAKASGATTLRIEGTIANERLYNVLQKRYGLMSSGATDSITIPLK
jgi:RHS repeat-associated protein